MCLHGMCFRESIKGHFHTIITFVLPFRSTRRASIELRLKCCNNFSLYAILCCNYVCHFHQPPSPLSFSFSHSLSLSLSLFHSRFPPGQQGHRCCLLRQINFQQKAIKSRIKYGAQDTQPGNTDTYHVRAHMSMCMCACTCECRVGPASSLFRFPAFPHFLRIFPARPAPACSKF